MSDTPDLSREALEAADKLSRYFDDDDFGLTTQECEQIVATLRALAAREGEEQATLSDDAIRIVWRAAVTGATNIAIDEQNRSNKDDAPSEVLEAQQEIIRRLKSWMVPDADELELIRSMLAPASPEGDADGA